MHPSQIPLKQFTNYSNLPRPQNIPFTYGFNQNIQNFSQFNQAPSYNTFSGPTQSAPSNHYFLQPNPLINKKEEYDFQGFSSLCKTQLHPPQGLSDITAHLNVQCYKTESPSTNMKKENANGNSKKSKRKVSNQEASPIEGGSTVDSKFQEESHANRKYKTYKKEDKKMIVDFIQKYGVEKALETFNDSESKLTKRKLALWQANIDKKKNSKGKLTNDPERDRGLSRWYVEFKEQYNRPPTRREIMDNALALSGVPEFRASKGWVDKIIKRLNFEVTLIKVKGLDSMIRKKEITTSETAGTSRKISMETADDVADDIPSYFLNENAPRKMLKENNPDNSDINSFFSFQSDQFFECNEDFPLLRRTGSLGEFFIGQ